MRCGITFDSWRKIVPCSICDVIVFGFLRISHRNTLILLDTMILLYLRHKLIIDLSLGLLFQNLMLNSQMGPPSSYIMYYVTIDITMTFCRWLETDLDAVGFSRTISGTTIFETYQIEVATCTRRKGYVSDNDRDCRSSFFTENDKGSLFLLLSFCTF